MCRTGDALAGHYGFIAALASTIIGAGVLFSLRADGWRVTAWVTAAVAVLLGLTSLVYRYADSSLGQT
jgi:amino acid permease